jgi:hypothetical protein
MGYDYLFDRRKYRREMSLNDDNQYFPYHHITEYIPIPLANNQKVNSTTSRDRVTQTLTPKFHRLPPSAKAVCFAALAVYF